MTEFVKMLSETTIEYAPVNKGSIINYNLDEEALKADGYKPLIKAEHPHNTSRLYRIKYKEDTSSVYEFIEYLETEDSFNARIAEEDYELECSRIISLINDLDIKRIRAICEPAIKNEATGETWLDYYNSQIIALREELKGLKNNYDK